MPTRTMRRVPNTRFFGHMCIINKGEVTRTVCEAGFIIFIFHETRLDGFKIISRETCFDSSACIICSGTERFVSGRDAWGKDEYPSTSCLKIKRLKSIAVAVLRVVFRDEISFHSSCHPVLCVIRFATSIVPWCFSQWHILHIKQLKVVKIQTVWTHVRTNNQPTVKGNAESKDKILSLPVPSDNRTPPKNSLLPRRSWSQTVSSRLFSANSSGETSRYVSVWFQFGLHVFRATLVFCLELRPLSGRR